MKYLKEREIFENQLERPNELEIISTIKDLCLDLTDEGFSIDIVPNYKQKRVGSKYKNFHRWNIFIVFEPGLENADFFKLGDVIDSLERIYDYMLEIGYVIEEVSSIDDHVNFNNISLDLDLNKWNKSESCLTLNLYFSEKLSESKYIKSYNLFKEHSLHENDDIEEIKSNLSDYLLDLKDDGLIVNVLYDNDQVYRFKTNDTMPYFRISVYDQHEYGLSFSEIEISKYKYNIENVIEYMDDLGYKLDYILTDMSNSVKVVDPTEHLIKCINSNRKIGLLDMFFVEGRSKLYESHSEEHFIDTIKDILLEISDDEAYDIKYLKFRKYKENKVEDYLEIRISRDREDPSNIRRTKRTISGAPVPPGGLYPANLFLWFEIKEPIIRLCEYVYEELELIPGINSKIFNDLRNMRLYVRPLPFRMFSGGAEFGIGWMQEEDFTLGDFTSFTSLKIEIRLK